MNASAGGKSRRAAGRVFGAVVAVVLLSVSAVNAQGSFTDTRDGKTYRTVKIGNQTWMAENLNYKTGKSWCYDNKDGNCQKYGRLYNWNTAMKACPAGWRLPTRQDWNDLVQAAGGKDVAGTKLKSKSQWDGTNDYGFSALPGGYRYSLCSFYRAGRGGYWWSATEGGSGDAWYWGMDSDDGGVNENYNDKDLGFSVLCVR